MNYFIIISVATLVIIAYIHYYGIKSTINPLYYQKPTDRSDTLRTINKKIDKFRSFWGLPSLILSKIKI